MAIVLKKKLRLAQPEFEQEESQDAGAQVSVLAELIDKVGKLSEEAELTKARIKKEERKLKPYQDALKELQAKLAGMGADADTPLEFDGKAFELLAGEQAKSRSIKDLHQVRQILGDATFMQLASVKMGDLDKYLTPPQLDAVLKTERGARSLKITRKAF
jgi:hypothetical protein